MLMRWFSKILLLGIASVSSVFGQLVVNPSGGPDISYLVIEAEDFGAPLYYGYRYTFDEEAPLDGYALAEAISGIVTDLSFSWSNPFMSDPPNYFLDSITFGDVTVENEPWPGSYWAQWVSGGESGYPVAEPIPVGEWTFGSGSSAPSRYHANGTSDGYVFGDGDAAPSIAPIPEPSVWLLVLGGVAFGFCFARRTRA